jgi:glycosyltransferase involved in cell wall biosynthesis
MRIAHVLPWPGIGGTERSTHQLTTFLEKRGHHNVAYCLPEATRMRDFLASSQIENTTYRAVQPSYRHPSDYFRASRELAADFRRRRIDIVHCSDLLGVYYAVLAARLARLPLLSHVRCNFPEISRRDQSFLWHVNRFIFISEAVRNGFAYRAGALKRGTVIYTGFDLQPDDRQAAAELLRKDCGIGATDRIVGMVARVAELKDFRTFAEAAAQILAIRSDVVFVVVGDYSQPQQKTHYNLVRSWIAELGIESRFIFTGHRDDAARLLAGMDISVLCTHSEGFGRVVVESMFQGTPAVGTDTGGVSEIIRHGENGLLHKPKDPADLAGCLLKLLDDPAYAQGIARSARVHAAARFGSAAFVEAIEKVYRSAGGSF